MADFFPSHPFKLEIIDRFHPQRSDIEHYIAQRYSLAFDAHLNSFMPTFMALMEGEEIRSLCGFRVASDEPLFLEQYLDEPADKLLNHVFHQPLSVENTANNRIERSNLIEFGQLASFSKGFSTLHFLLMTKKLVESGYEWCIFTATDPLYAMMSRLGLESTVLAEADPSRIPDATYTWGNYYQHQPRIVAGNLKHGLAHLEALFAEKVCRARGGAL
ncbi:thermostable hemolysin [Vibrio sp. Y2-5]|uniref:thermostable hemolysin n=1 Tax=Vibrio sp. Y2-5 TaxID=2743977 RepID=UPI0016611479|nr:thermostable hemolysin [Vibrio sp. Y2-5]MBD0785949.1 thermostable hemolysin [Vibrio sp. Y2-5]